MGFLSWNFSDTEKRKSCAARGCYGQDVSAGKRKKKKRERKSE